MRRRLLLVLVLPLYLAWALPIWADSPTNGIDFTVSGVLISTKTRSALINGAVAREGERVDGIEILEINEYGVRVLNGSAELMVPVGSTTRLAPSAAPVIYAQDEPATRPETRRVNAGETLSLIAGDYAGAGQSLNQVMMALYEANPHAFDGNINRLKAGAELQVPSHADIARRPADVALAEVLQQTERWRGGDNKTDALPLVAELLPPVEVEAPIDDIDPAPDVYGPVGYGETLSEIALRLAGDGISMHRMMAALFEENPEAFGGSVDFLREGAVLRIPEFDAIDPNAALAATSH
jgi:FimV-like protein